jgi:hypothetical protein
MKTVYHCLAVVVLLWLCPLGAHAQASSSQQSGENQAGTLPSQAGDTVTSAEPSEPPPALDEHAPVPPPASIAGPTLAFSELERGNYLRGGIGLSTTYDDNVFNTGNQVGNTPSTQMGGFTWSALPHLALDITTSRLRWTSMYSAGLTVNQRLSSQNQGSYSLGTDFEYRLSPHVSVAVTERFTLTTGFFDSLQSSTDLSGGGILQQPNSSVVTPLAKSIGNNVSGQLSWQFGAGSMVGISGNYFTSRFQDAPAGQSLLDTTTESASAFYSHRITTRNWSGVRYGFEHLTFAPGTERADTHSLMAFHTVYLKPTMQLSFFGGPEYSEVDSQFVFTQVILPQVLMTSVPVSNKRWSGAGGASYSWQGPRTSITAEFVRRVTGGGGILGTTQMNSATAGLRRRVTPSTTLSFGASYAVNDALMPTTAGIAALKTAMGSAGISRRLGTHFGLELSYARVYQEQSSGGGPVVPANHNRGLVSLSYDFSRPLGR